MSTNNFLPETFIIPEDPEEKDLKIRDYLNDIASATNSKDSGFYEEEETITGQKFIPVFSSDGSKNASYRDVFRKAIDFGALPSISTKSIPHGIDFDLNFSMTKLYAAATHPGVMSIPIPNGGENVSQVITINIDPKNINITTKSNRSAFTRCFVVIEYIKTL